ncbi:MAG: 5'-nucleotidase C-terminal domain-containing protein [Kofleriaceae bacterium]|nr:5'-nucleotidase C-terminal domain-containing protein [Kofleriaceae bacterium]MCB9571583.1 5'-nucleotidase C-terminal domain-containing protein [Kofleriaceae bacterium]
MRPSRVSSLTASVLTSVVSVALGVALVASCGHAAEPAPRPPPVAKRGNVTITIVGTNDLHGAIDRLPILAGYLANVRAARAADGGAVLLIDAGDMFQGTLESNLNEGHAVIEAYNALGYTASTVGNHEFDFGPPGPAVTAQAADDDPRGALKARAAEAIFPILSANIDDVESGARIKWPNMPASVTVDAAGVKVGIIGVTTEATPFTTMPANFAGLAMVMPAVAVQREAEALRAAGAELVVVTAHVGSKCSDLHDPSDLSSCDTSEELFRMADALPRGLVDVIVAGHTHAAVAHRINDIDVIESYSSGRAFGRVDLRINAEGRVVASTIRQPQDLCPLDGDGHPVAAEVCDPGDYEGRPVVRDAAIQAIVDGAMAPARELRDEKLGVTELAEAFPKAYDAESAEGNLFVDLMLRARPDVEVAMTNGGGLRADLPAGPLTYGALYEAMPFDNRFAIVAMQGKHLRKLISNNLHGSSGIFSWGGLTVDATCSGGELVVTLRDAKGKPIDDERTVTVATSDFLASGGDGAIGRLKLPEGSVTETDVIIRDALADLLRAQPVRSKPAPLRPRDYFDPAKPRLSYPKPRPVSCQAAGRRPPP